MTVLNSLGSRHVVGNIGEPSLTEIEEEEEAKESGTPAFSRKNEPD
jgi:hypothetical protein